VWFAVGRVPRSSEDISVEERAAEAGWIGETLRTRGLDVPEDVIEDVLRLHGVYLEGDPLDAPREPFDASSEPFDASKEPFEDSREPNESPHHPYDASTELFDSRREE
jgi:hypothetical protein